MSKYEKIQVSIPVENKWTLEDIDKKALDLGMDRTSMILNAVDFFMNLDTPTYEKMIARANGLHIPLWLYMQNKMIKDMAQLNVEFEMGKNDSKLVDEFIMMESSEGTKILTGVELYKNLKELYTLVYKKNERINK